MPRGPGREKEREECAQQRGDTGSLGKFKVALVYCWSVWAVSAEGAGKVRPGPDHRGIECWGRKGCFLRGNSKQAPDAGKAALGMVSY